MGCFSRPNPDPHPHPQTSLTLPLQATFIEESLLYSQGLGIFIAFGLRASVLEGFTTAWAACCAGPCCAWLAEIRDSLRDSFRLSVSTTHGSLPGVPSSGPSTGQPPLASGLPPTKKGLKKNRFNSQSQPSLSALGPQPGDSQRAAERLERDLLEDDGGFARISAGFGRVLD